MADVDGSADQARVLPPGVCAPLTFEEAVELAEAHKAFRRFDETYVVWEESGILRAGRTAPETGGVVACKRLATFSYAYSSKRLWLDGDGVASPRLNMRGATFDADTGELLALPFAKFFNLGELGVSGEEDGLEEAVVIAEKLDGSLISFFAVSEDLVGLKSIAKCHNTVACLARECLDQRADVAAFAQSMVRAGWSPVFEFIGPAMRIVLAYPDNDWVFLGARHMETGEMRLACEWGGVPPTVRVPRVFATPQEAQEYLEGDSVEGVVYKSPSGRLWKLKAATYLRLHRWMRISTPRVIVKQVSDGTWDDRSGLLAQHGFHERLRVMALVAQWAMDRCDALTRWAEAVVREHTDGEGQVDRAGLAGAASALLPEGVPSELRKRTRTLLFTVAKSGAAMERSLWSMVGAEAHTLHITDFEDVVAWCEGPQRGRFIASVSDADRAAVGIPGDGPMPPIFVME